MVALWGMAVVVGVCCVGVGVRGVEVGYVLGSGPFSAPDLLLVDQLQSIQEMKTQGGVNWIRVAPTLYINSSTSSSVLPIHPPLSFSSEPPSLIGNYCAHAASLDMHIVFGVRLDYNWAVFDGDVGERVEGWNPGSWDDALENYGAAMVPYWRACPQAEVVQLFEGLDRAAENGNWSSVISLATSVYGEDVQLFGSVTREAMMGGGVGGWEVWKELDFVGVDGFWELNVTGTYPHSTTPSQLQPHWIPFTSALNTLYKTSAKPILLDMLGVQSRPSAWQRPMGIMTRDPTDCSCWEECVDLESQAAYFFSAQIALSPLPFLHTIFVHLWRTDLTAQGTRDDTHVVRGKPAMMVVKQWAGGNSVVGVKEDDGVEEVGSEARGIAAREGNVTKLNGMVFGSGMWSTANVTLTSNTSLQSLNTFVAETGGNALRIITNYFVANISKQATTVFPKPPSSALRSATLEELQSFITTARTDHNLNVQLAPYIDPDFDNPLNCRGPSCGKIPGTAPKAGRGSIGEGYGEAEWDAFFDSYTNDFILPHAKVAEAAGAEWFCVGAELATAFRQNDRWPPLIEAVRKVYSGKLIAAINYGQAIALPPIPWLELLDGIGVECYVSLSTPIPKFGRPTLSDLLKAWTTPTMAMEKLSNATGKGIMCTEVGYQSRFNTTLTPASTNMSDPFSTLGRVALNVDLDSQALAYQALLQSLYPKPWFLGVHWWLWQADGSASGTSDTEFSPKGKPASTSVLQRWYRWYS